MRPFTSISISIFLNLLLFSMMPYMVENREYREREDLIKVDLIKIEKKRESTPEIKNKKEIKSPVKKVEDTPPPSPPLQGGEWGGEPSPKPVKEDIEAEEIPIIKTESNEKDAEVSAPIPVEDKAEKGAATIIPSPPLITATEPPPSEKIEEMVKEGDGDSKKAVEFVPLFKITKLPEFIKQVESEYPESARRVNKEGVVLLEVSIDSEGKVIEAKVIKSAGADLDYAAIESVKGSTFSPALSGEKAVAVKIKIPFRFELR